MPFQYAVFPVVRERRRFFSGKQGLEVAGNGLQEWALPVSHLAPGLYFLHLSDGLRSVFEQRVVKM